MEGAFQLKDEVGVEAAGDRPVEVAAVVPSRLCKPQLGKPCMPGAGGNPDDVIGREGKHLLLVGAAEAFGVTGVLPLAVPQVGPPIKNLHPVADRPLGHPAAALFGIAAGRMKEGHPPPFPERPGQPDVKARGDCRMDHLVELHCFSLSFQNGPDGNPPVRPIAAADFYRMVCTQPFGPSMRPIWMPVRVS